MPDCDVDNPLSRFESVLVFYNGGLFYQNYFEFEGAVRYLMQHPVEYMQLCSNARAYITANYDWESIMQRFSQIIEWVSAEKN